MHYSDCYIPLQPLLAISTVSTINGLIIHNNLASPYQNVWRWIRSSGACTLNQVYLVVSFEGLHKLSCQSAQCSHEVSKCLSSLIFFTNKLWNLNQTLTLLPPLTVFNDNHQHVHENLDLHIQFPLSDFFVKNICTEN